MNLVDLYIQEVTRRLPEKMREDIALELHSTIQDMLPDNYSEEEVKSVLSQLGNPVVLASGYRDRPMYLIGPRYFDLYMNLLKMILPIAIAISVISLLADNLVSYRGEEGLINLIILVIIDGIGIIASTGIQVFFWLTITFIIIERTDNGKSQLPLTTHFKEWTPDDLKDLSHSTKGKEISRIEVLGGLLWTAIWATVYFNASNLLGVYEKREGVLTFITPTFNQEVLHSYWLLIVVVVALEIFLAIYKIISLQWTKKLAIINAAYQMVSTIIFIIIISNLELFNKGFLTYMNDIFTPYYDNWLLLSLVTAAIIFVLFALIDSYAGFRKARIKQYRK